MLRRMQRQNHILRKDFDKFEHKRQKGLLAKIDQDPAPSLVPPILPTWLFRLNRQKQETLPYSEKNSNSKKDAQISD